MALYWFVRRHRGVEVATVTVLALVTMPYFYGASQYANLDMLVAAMITLTILSGAEAVSRSVHHERFVKTFAMAAGVFAALAVLSKGLIGIVLPGGVLFFWLLATRRWRGFGALLGLHVWLAFAVVALPWFIAMEIQHRGFLHYFFVYQHFERYLTSGFNQQQPAWFFLPVVFGMSLPWSLWLLRYIWQRAAVVFEASWFWLMGIWIVLIVTFFSIPDSKLIGYTVPVLPPLAVLIAEAVVACFKGPWSIRDKRLLAVTFVAAAASCLIALIVFMFANDRSSRPVFWALQSQMQPQDQFVYLDVYPFDLAFYTENPKPAWVVFNWPGLPKGDTWGHGLAEAGGFSPEKAREVLVTDDALLPKICASVDQTYWFVAYAETKNRFEFIKALAPAFAYRYGVEIWKLPVDAAFKQKWCQGGVHESTKS